MGKLPSDSGGPSGGKARWRKSLDQRGLAAVSVTIPKRISKDLLRLAQRLRLEGLPRDRTVHFVVGPRGAGAALQELARKLSRRGR